MDSSSRQEGQEEEPLGVRTSSRRRSSEVERPWRELAKSLPDHGGTAEASMLEGNQNLCVCVFLNYYLFRTDILSKVYPESLPWCSVAALYDTIFALFCLTS